jgi:hypothetical protein
MPGERRLPRREGGDRPREPSRSKPTFPVAALLFAPASVLGVMANNLNQTSFADVAPSLAGTFAFALLAWLAVAALRRRADAATAVIACLWVAGSLFYLGLFGRVNAWLGGGYPMVRPLPFALAALALLSLALHRWSRPAAALHTVLGTIALVMVATPLWQAAAYEWRQGGARAAYDADEAARALPQIAGPEARGAGAPRPPDIYHFVFDRYASEDTLARAYGVEAPIYGFLEARGFYVARDSRSNYNRTAHSLASTFYMDYLDFLSEDPRVDQASWRPLYRMLDDHRVARFLQARGYEFLQFGSWWVGTYNNPVAARNRPRGFSEFGMIYLRRTALRPLLHLLPDTPFTMRLDWDNAQCQRVARQVEEIKAIGERDEERTGPVYVFAHILVPHGPEVFTRDGRCLTQQEWIERGEVQGYIDQVAYADRLIEDLVTTLQADGRTPPVILIQADEGPFPEREPGVPWQDASPEELRIKTGILNAYYFPGGDYRLLRPDITPVNSYRVLFNTVFGTDFPQLPDRTFVFPHDRRLYEFHDVTSVVRGGLAASGDGGSESSGPPRVR